MAPGSFPLSEDVSAREELRNSRPRTVGGRGVFPRVETFFEGSNEPVEILTDHDSLRYFHTTTSLTRRQVRWTQDLACFSFTIWHRPGNKNPADAPSRRQDYGRHACKEDKVELEDRVPLQLRRLLGLEKTDGGATPCDGHSAMGDVEVRAIGDRSGRVCGAVPRNGKGERMAFARVEKEEEECTPFGRYTALRCISNIYSTERSWHIQVQFLKEFQSSKHVKKKST